MTNSAAKKQLTATTFCYQREGKNSENTKRTLVFLTHSYITQKKKAKGNSMVTILFSDGKLGIRLKSPFYYCLHLSPRKSAQLPSEGWNFLEQFCRVAAFQLLNCGVHFLSLQLNAARILTSEVCSTVRSTMSECLYTLNDTFNS